MADGSPIISSNLPSYPLNQFILIPSLGVLSNSHVAHIITNTHWATLGNALVADEKLVLKCERNYKVICDLIIDIARAFKRHEADTTPQKARVNHYLLAIGKLLTNK